MTSAPISPKTNHLSLITIHLLVAANAAFAQGSLTPPGAPAPTMKTLSQIESRIVIDPSAPGFTTPYNITQPGSYYLAGNINISDGTDGIRIQADNVTLDLNGFAIISTSSPAAGRGITFYIHQSINVLIRNGAIHGNFLAGVDNTGAGSGSINARVADLAVSYCTQTGINLFVAASNPGLVERCTVYGNGGITSTGIRGANVSHCNVFGASGTGIDAKVCSDCYAEGALAGISAATVSNSYASSSGIGIQAQTVTNSTGVSSGGAGIQSSSGLQSTATGSYGSGTSGIVVQTATNCVGVGTTGPGISADVATGCRGNSTSGLGVFANYIATNCLGISSSGRGLSTASATNCFGQTAAGDIALTANIANSCRGWKSSGSGDAINATIAIGCTSAGGTITTPAGGKFLGTP